MKKEDKYSKHQDQTSPVHSQTPNHHLNYQTTKQTLDPPTTQRETEEEKRRSEEEEATAYT